PIRMILGFCEALLKPSENLSETHRADIEAIYRNAQQLNALIDALPIAAAHAVPPSAASQVIVLDRQGAVYEFFREYLSASRVMRVAEVEEIGRLGQDVQPSAIIIGTGDDSLIPLITRLAGSDIPILSLSFQAPQSQPHYLMKPIQFGELEAL